LRFVKLCEEVDGRKLGELLVNRSIHLIPLSVIVGFLLASVAAAQNVPGQTLPDQYQYGADQYQYGTDQYDAGQGLPEQPAIEGCEGDPNLGGNVQMTTVTIQPAVISGQVPIYVNPGTTVRWINGDTLPHTVTADDGTFDSGRLRTGESCTRTFDEPGTTWTYHDRLDARRTGSVIVGGAPPPPAAEPAQYADDTAT
jgi:plastocyanin